jgi:hypothetical protein
MDPEQAKQEAEAQQQRRGTFDGRAPRKLSNKTHRSCTDPDATLAQKKGTPRQLKYKVHQTIDADSRVILDTEVTTGARHDNQPYLAQLKRASTTRSDLWCNSRSRIRLGRLFARDPGQQASTFIPLWSGRVGKQQVPEGRMVYEKNMTASVVRRASI